MKHQQKSRNKIRILLFICKWIVWSEYKHREFICWSPKDATSSVALISTASLLVVEHLDVVCSVPYLS